mgnify:CR=1 FL=1
MRTCMRASLVAAEPMYVGEVMQEPDRVAMRKGRALGEAFQIADDLLDVEGDQELAGKALRKDDGQGKATFVTLMGADKARAQARMLVEQAASHLSGYGEEARLLQALARYIVERDH